MSFWQQKAEMFATVFPLHPSKSSDLINEKEKTQSVLWQINSLHGRKRSMKNLYKDRAR